MHLSPNNNHLPPVWAQPKKIPHKHPHGRNSAHPIDITPNNSSKARGIQPENLLKKVLPFPLKHKANSTLPNSSNKNPNNRVWKPKKNPSFLITRNYKQPSSISATSEYHKNRTRDTEISILSPFKKKSLKVHSFFHHLSNYNNNKIQPRAARIYITRQVAGMEVKQRKRRKKIGSASYSCSLIFLFHF